jgi:hypothetical protein
VSGMSGVSAHLDKVAEAICGASHAGKLFPWSGLSEVERDAWRAMAAAAVDALGLTEEVGFRHRFPNGRSVLLEDADVKVARVLAATTGSEITEVSRLVSPWVVQPEAVSDE